MKNKKLFLAFIPLMMTFFTMGFVDIVGIATNYVKVDFGLSDTVANLLPLTVFLWFLVLSIPAAALMNRFGRKNIVIASVVITFASMLIPIFDYSLSLMLIAFGLLGIGNALMQVSLNPLLSNILPTNRLAASLTLGQFFKGLASFAAPIVAVWAATFFGSWLMIFPFLAFITLTPTVWLLFTDIEESLDEGRNNSILDSFRLFRNATVLLCFIAIIMHVGTDVGINTTAPKLMMERLGLPLAQASFATSFYFLARTIGCLMGSFVLSHVSARKVFLVSVLCVLGGLVGLWISNSGVLLFGSLVLVGLGNSNLFAIIFSEALNEESDRRNEVSGLMIMGLTGGAIFPLLMGVASDATDSQAGAIGVLFICAAYLLLLTPRIRKHL